MFSLNKVLVVAGVALVLPVLGASSAHADSGDGNGRSESKSSAQPVVREDAPKDAAVHGSNKADKDSKDSAAAPASSSTGKGSQTDTSGSSTNPDGTFQGKGSSTPDQDGKGMDRGADNNDKTGPGTDGNNGCGNEPRAAAPRDGGRPTDDDNNGWCGSKPKPVKKAQPVKAQPAAPVKAARVAAPAVAAPRVAAPTGVTQVAVAVPATTTTRTAPVAAPVRKAAPAARPAALRMGPVQVAGTAVAAGAGVVVMGPPTGLAVPATVVAQSAVAPQALPFTGAPVGLLALLAGLAVGVGAFLTVAARRTA